jgi:hypothetical protein
VIATASLALALAAGPACGLPARGAPSWRSGEMLAMDLDLFGVVRAGTLSLAVERPMSAGKIVPLVARAKSTESVQVKRLTAVALSWIEKATGLPERYRDESKEDDVHRSSDARLLPAGPEVVIETRTGEREGRSAFAREGPVLDPLSALYYLRAAPLAPGDRLCFDLVALGRFWRVEGTVAGRTERVESPAGRFETIRVDLVGRRADRPERQREVHLWLSDDARRLPVAAVGEIDLGPVRMLLSRVEGARAR